MERQSSMSGTFKVRGASVSEGLAQPLAEAVARSERWTLPRGRVSSYKRRLVVAVLVFSDVLLALAV